MKKLICISLLALPFLWVGCKPNENVSESTDARAVKAAEAAKTKAAAEKVAADKAVVDQAAATKAAAIMKAAFDQALEDNYKANDMTE